MVSIQVFLKVQYISDIHSNYELFFLYQWYIILSLLLFYVLMSGMFSNLGR